MKNPMPTKKKKVPEISSRNKWNKGGRDKLKLIRITKIQLQTFWFQFSRCKALYCLLIHALFVQFIYKILSSLQYVNSTCDKIQIIKLNTVLPVVHFAKFPFTFKNYFVIKVLRFHDYKHLSKTWHYE